MTVYARVEAGFAELFWRLVQELAHWGFGSDRSAGKGQFRLDSQLEPANDLDAPAEADGCVVLSTFQPAATDPTDGAWEAFTKYGKLGPDFGLENVFKRPMIVFRPGACFRGQLGPRLDGAGHPHAGNARRRRRRASQRKGRIRRPLGLRVVPAAAVATR